MKTLTAAVAAFVLACGTPVATLAQPSGSEATVGTVVGLVTNAANAPVARATVTATSADGRAMRATVSTSEGLYTFADLPPGRWLISVQGAGGEQVATLDVRPGQANRYDIVMRGAAPGQPATAVVAQAPAPPASVPATVPLALQEPPPAPENDTETPFAVGYLGWMNGTSRAQTPVFDTNFFTPEVRFDVNYLQSFNHPVDHTIVGSTEEFRSGEFQIEQVSFGGDFHWNNVRARFLSMYGLFAVTTPRNDASAGVGEWDLQGAYKYFSEANAGYHWDVNHGLNLDAGVFVSYIGLFSYYNFDNWTYQPSFVSSNTPWFFNGMRVQWFPTQTLKIEPWLINGWQSYAKYNKYPGV